MRERPREKGGMRKTWLIALLVAALAGAARAEEVCGEEVAPLLRVLADFTSSETVGSSTLVKVIYRNGRMAQSTLERYPPEGPPAGGGIVVRILSTPELRALSDDLAAAQIGFAQDCHWTPPCCGVQATMRVVWYGRGGRIRTFLATSDPALPACSPALSALLHDVILL